MGIGVSIFLIAVGLILALAVDVDLSGLDVQTIGWILTLVGIGGLALTMYLARSRRTVVREDVLADRPVVREQHIIREDPRAY